MNTNVIISQFAAGSRPSPIGDTTLFYSAGFSKHANDVSGLFLDNPPVLSPHHASLVWRYYRDVDRYMLIHVQGSHVVSTSMGRNYPFRAGYEVSRDDMNAIGFQLSSLFSVMPRIEGMGQGRVEAIRNVSYNATTAPRSMTPLATHLCQAMLQNRRLYVGLDINGDGYRCDGIFNAPELRFILDAIESLPLSLRRHAGFGFCVDNHFSFVLDDVLLVVYENGRMTVPQDAISLTWQQAVSTQATLDPSTFSQLLNIQLPGDKAPILTLAQLHRALAVNAKQPTQLQGDDWPIWLSLGHQLKEVPTRGWNDFHSFYNKMDASTQTAYVNSVRQASLRWSLDGFDKTLLSLMKYSPEEQEQWTRMAVGTISFNSVQDVINVLSKVKADSKETLPLKEMAVRNLKEKTLRDLLAADSPVAQCENLLKTSTRLPASWTSFATEKVLPAVIATLFGNGGVWTKEQLLDTKNWPRLAALQKQTPHVYMLLEDKLQSLFLTSPYTQLAQTVRKMRSEQAWPIINLFITTIKKRNKKMANDMEKLFKELKGAKNKRNRSRMNIALLVCGLICGILLTAGVLMAYNRLFGEEPAKLSGASIEWVNSEQENLMVRLADLSEWSGIDKVCVDTFSMSNITFNKTADLLPLNQHFYSSPATLSPDNARAVVYSVDAKGEATVPNKMDTIGLTKEKSLLANLCDKPCRIDRILVADTFNIIIPNKELFPADSTGLNTQDAKYYFRVVKYVHQKLPKDIQIAY